MRNRYILGVTFLTVFVLAGCGSGGNSAISVTDSSSIQGQADDVPQEQIVSAYDESTTSESASDGLDISVDFDIAPVQLLSKDIYANGHIISLNSSVQTFLDAGFQTDLDMEQMIASCQTTDAFSMDVSGAERLVRAVNPYENKLALKDCMVCSIYTEDTTGMILLSENGPGCGLTKYDEVNYGAVYAQTNAMKVYRNLFGVSISSVSLTIGNESADGKGEQLLTDHDEQCTFAFENGTLKSFHMEDLALEYNDMQDNVSAEKLKELDAGDMEKLVETRALILLELQQAMADAGITISVNDVTGEITMNNDVLFALDSAELSEEGMTYLDKFTDAYASVISSEKYSDLVAGICFEGHTDSAGEDDYNLNLSQKRANTVMDYCLQSTDNHLTMEQRDLMLHLSEAIGYGSADLICDENGNEDAQASRRVAIKFYLE